MLISVSPALAGGTWLDPSWERVEAGDHVELSGFVANGQLRWIEEGPFFAYLSGDAYGQVVARSAGGTETDVPLGELGAIAGSSGVQVSIDFMLPTDIPRGEYRVLVCNKPCTTGLGDLVGGVIYVGVDAPSFEEEITSIDPGNLTLSGTSLIVADDTPVLARHMSLAPYPRRPSGLAPSWIAISAGLAAIALLATITLRRSTGTR
jgi:hypothetical protein